MTIGLRSVLIVFGILALLSALVPRRRRSSWRWKRTQRPESRRGVLNTESRLQHQAVADHLAPLDLSDYGDQLKAVEAAVLKPKKPVNWSASVVLRQLEEIVRTRPGRHYRVFAEISLGAFVATNGPKGREQIGTLAWKSINAKRVDFLIIDKAGHPAMAVEYHGAGHHQNGRQAAARDAVKRRALEKAGIELVEIHATYDAKQSQMMVEHALDRYEKHTRSTVVVSAAE